MDRIPNSTPARCTDALSQILKVTDCNKVDFLVEARSYEVLLKTVPRFGPRCTTFVDTDPWSVTIWTPDDPSEIKATLVEMRDLLVPEGYKDMGMPKYIASLAYVKINGEPAFPDLAAAIEAIRKVSDPNFWRDQSKIREPIPA